MSPFSSLPRTRFRSALAAISLVVWPTVLLASCRATAPAPTPDGRLSLARSLEVELHCRRRVSELPAGATPVDIGKAYGDCLRQLSDSMPAQATPSPRTEGLPQNHPDPAMAPDTWASPAERQLHCQLHSDQIRAAAERYNRAALAFNRVANQPTGSFTYQEAHQALLEAFANVDKELPQRFRQGKPLIPDALGDFQDCRALAPS